jgi:hypothetical protein
VAFSKHSRPWSLAHSIHPRRQIAVTAEDGTWTSVGADVTAALRSRVVGGLLRVPLPLVGTLGDPCFGVAKVARQSALSSVDNVEPEADERTVALGGVTVRENTSRMCQTWATPPGRHGGPTSDVGLPV